jgi:plastocyanin
MVKRASGRVCCVALVLASACSGGGNSAATPTSVHQPSVLTGSSASASGAVSDAATTSGPPATDISGDPVLDANGNVDADVVAQASDALRFDKGEYDGKADLTIGLFNQGSMHHTLLIEGQSNFKLEVFHHGEARVGDIKLNHGTYTIYCEIHRADGMTAKLVIP